MSFIGKTLKVTGWITRTAAVGVAAVVLANAFDEQLAPEVKALLERPAPQVAEPDNLLNALIGFPIVSADVAQNEAFWRIGVRKREVRRVAVDDDARQHAYDVTGDEQKLSVVGDRALLCTSDARRESDCLSAVAAHRDAVEQLLIDNAEWLRRFHALQRYSTFAADAPISWADPWLPSSEVSTGHALARTEVALQWGPRRSSGGRRQSCGRPAVLAALSGVNRRLSDQQASRRCRPSQQSRAGRHDAAHAGADAG